MSDPTCARCARPMRHDTALIDAPCANLLRKHLEGVAKIAGDITITVAKLARVAKGGGQTEDLGWWKNPNALEAIPLPVDLDAAQRHDAAVLELNTWALLIIQDRGTFPQVYVLDGAKPGPMEPERHPLRRTALLLAANVEWLRHQPFADEAWPALLAACSELERIIDAKPAGELVGLCSCGTALYAHGPGVLHCPRCREERDPATSRADMEAALHGAHVTASEAAQWVAKMGLITDTAKLRKLIWAWADRGHIAPVEDGPRYVFGEVLRRVLDSPALLRAAA